MEHNLGMKIWDQLCACYAEWMKWWRGSEGGGSFRSLETKDAGLVECGMAPLQGVQGMTLHPPSAAQMESS